MTIDATGMYYLWFVICDPKLAGAESLSLCRTESAQRKRML